MYSRNKLIGLALAILSMNAAQVLAEENTTIEQISSDASAKDEKKPVASMGATPNRYSGAPIASDRYVICIYGASDNLTAEINDQGRLIVAKRGTVLPSGEHVVEIEPNKAMVAKVSKDKKGRTTMGKPYAVWLQGAVGGPSATQGLPMPSVPGMPSFVPGLQR